MPGTNPWTNIKDLSIQVYDGTDGKTTLADETFIYANNKHTAIIVISFKAIDANDNDINSSDLPTADRLRSSIKLLDYNTGLNLEVNEPWAVVTKLDAFTAPIGAADGGKTLTGNTAQLVGNAYTFKFFVKTDAPDFSGINNVKDVDIGVEIDISKLVAGGGSIFKSCIGGDFLESCTIHAIRKYALPKEILTQEIVTVNCENNGTPEDDSSQLSQDHYYREIHFAYHFDLSEAEDDFQYNNKICRAEISLKDPPYTPTQQSSLDTNEDDPTGGSAANSALEPCCFLDRRDGLYSYKAYLWPACLMDMANSTKLEPETLIPERGILQEYNLYKDGFEKNTVNLSTLFTNNKNFKFATDTVIYISVYLTFGYMAQHYARGTYYKLNIVDQYGNILKVETDPAACPQIFSPDEDSDQNGLHKFTDIENPPQWLSVPTDDKIRYYNIGDPKNLYFWLVSGGQNSNSILTYNYKTTGSNEIDSLNFIPVSDYNNITFTPTLQAGFQTYRLLNDKTEIQNAQYKLAFYDNGLSQTATLGITQGNHSYVLQTLPIYEIDSQYTIEWQFCPVWENGTFIMWGNKLPDFNRQRTTLMNSDTSPYYDIGAPSMGFEVAEFAALPAHRIEDGVVKNELLDGKFDTGSNGPKDPFAASGTNTARGDWASVNAVIMTWTQTDYSGLSIYRNGHHRGEIWLTFNAQNLKDGSITGNCNQPPKPKFVQNSIDIVDYETGQSITSLNEGWRYEVFVQDPNDPNDVNPYKKYTSAIRQGEFGIITSHLNPDAGKPYNFNVYIYISNNSSNPLSKDRTLGVRFIIYDEKWGCPITVTRWLGDGKQQTFPSCRTIDPIKIGSNAYDIKLKYEGDFKGNTDRDNSPSPIGDKGLTDLTNCNRHWDLKISIKPEANSGNKIIGWTHTPSKEINNRYSEKNKYGTCVGRLSNGIFHNEFVLHNLGQFVDNDPNDMEVNKKFPSDGSTTAATYTPINDCQYTYASQSLDNESNAYLWIKIFGSFLGESVFWSAFPSQNFQFVDLYGNRYDFSLDFSALGMFYTNSEVSSLISSNYHDFLTTDVSNIDTETNDKVTANYYLSTTGRDHTIKIGTFHKGSTADIVYYSPDRNSVIQFLSLDESDYLSTTDPESLHAYLHFPRTKIENNDKKLYLGIEYNDAKLHGYMYMPSVAGYLGIDTHWIYSLHAIWEGGKVCFTLHSDSTATNPVADVTALTIYDRDGDGEGVVGMYEYGYFDNYQFFTLSIEK